MLETFFHTHQFLVDHTDAPVRRALMSEVDWKRRLIGIKGSRGVGKTTFLLQYAKENFGSRNHKCLYINMNNFYFQGHTLFQFASEFVRDGGQVLLIDQVFKYHDWSHELRLIHDKLPQLKVVFTGSSVMRLKEENVELNGLVDSYNLRGFSFREYLNVMTGNNFRSYNMREIENHHEHIVKNIMEKANPVEYFQSYLHHGYYPFFLENTYFSENLLKTINMMIEVDILFLKQIDLKYLDKIKQLYYLLATGGTGMPNVSQLAADMHTSRATVVNYMKYLMDARMLNMMYRLGDQYPKKPSGIMLHNTNLLYAMSLQGLDRQTLMDTFFQNALWGRHKINLGDRSCTFVVDETHKFRICLEAPLRKMPEVTYAVADPLADPTKDIPLWLYGFLY